MTFEGIMPIRSFSKLENVVYVKKAHISMGREDRAKIKKHSHASASVIHECISQKTRFLNSGTNVCLKGRGHVEVHMLHRSTATECPKKSHCQNVSTAQRCNKQRGYNHKQLLGVRGGAQNNPVTNTSNAVITHSYRSRNVRGKQFSLSSKS